MAKRVTSLFAVVALGGGLGGIGTASAEPARPLAPRTLPSGAPACGNAQTKSPQPCPTTGVAIEPRTLPTGAPAAGNVLSKGGGNKRDPSESDAQGSLGVRNNRVVTRVLRLLGITSLTVPVARPRELRTGAPAPGNVARRTAPREERLREPAREIHHD